VEIVVRRWVIEIEEPTRRGEHLVEIEERLAHAHVDGMVHGPEARKWSA
jgi:hypothetical protein